MWRKGTFKNLGRYSFFDVDYLERNMRNFKGKEHLVIQLKLQLVGTLFECEQATSPLFYLFWLQIQIF